MNEQATVYLDLEELRHIEIALFQYRRSQPLYIKYEVNEIEENISCVIAALESEKAANMNKPTAEDWLKVGNGLRTVMGLPLNHYASYPSEDILNAYEDILPGSRKLLEDAAVAEMNHRLTLEKLK